MRVSASLSGLREFLVDDEEFRLGMIERKGDGRRIEPGVERVEHAARHRHAVMAFEHGRRIGEHHRDRVALLDAGLGQRRGEPAGAGIEVRIGVRAAAMDDRRCARDRRRPSAQGRTAATGAGSWRRTCRDRCHRRKQSWRWSWDSARGHVSKIGCFPQFDEFALLYDAAGIIYRAIPVMRRKT